MSTNTELAEDTLYAAKVDNDHEFLGRYATFRRVLGTQPERPYLPIDGNAHRLCELAGAAQLTHAQIQIVRSLVGIIVEIKP